VSDDFPSTSSATAALLTPIPNGKVLAALFGVNGLKGRVLENSAGTLAVLDDSSDRALHAAAAIISNFAKDAPLVALVRRDGQITAWKYFAGERGDTQAPGLILNEAPGVVSTIMSGAQTIDQVAATHPDKVFDAHMSRIAALKLLRASAKLAKRQRP